MSKLSVVIQAGGESSRMGQDKGLIPFMGEPLIEHILGQVEGLGDETLVITNQPEDYRYLNLPTHKDVYPHVGALGGLHAAIYHASYEHCLLLACDMPFINRPLLEHLISLAPNFDAVIPRLKAEEFAEPFRAVYHKRCLTAIEAAIKEGQRRVISFFDSMHIRFVDQAEISQYDPDGISFFNINTPADLAEAERLAANNK